jgi:putative aldouronate transport system permease protein
MDAGGSMERSLSHNSTSLNIRRKATPMKKIIKHWQLYLLILPPLASLILFKYVPMYGVQIAFREFNAALGIAQSPWIGMQNFMDFFSSYQFPRLMINTVVISVYSIAVGFPIPIILAISLNEAKNRVFSKTVQMVTYAPYFLSTVVMVAILFQFMSKNGLLNNTLSALGLPSIDLMNYPWLFKSLYVWSGVWQTTGYSAVIYIAVLSGINHELYDAARIDGASTFQKILNIDVPGIMPTAIILLILSSAQILNVSFEKIFLMQNPLNMEVSDVISTYVYRTGLVSAQYSYAAAIGLFNSVISLALLVIVNQIARKYSETSLW